MGHTSHLLHMVFIIAFFFVSFYFAHILISKSSHGYLISNGGGGGGLSLTPNKFRFLLGLNSFGIIESRNGDSAYFSPSQSPSPLPSPAPAPSPTLHFHHHARPPTHHRHPFPRADKVQNKDRGKAARILTAVLASVAVTSVLCLIGLFFGCKKLKKQRRRPRKSRVISKFMSSQSAVKKVTSDPGPDPFYLESLESALEQEKCCVSTFARGDEVEGSDKKVMNSECESGRCSSVGEITTVHEISETVVNQEHDEDVLDKIVPEDACSSDDESFHSLCDSQSSYLRLSNASACSVSETSETMSKDEIKEAQPQPPPSAAPPPPPPPPPRPAGVSQRQNPRPSPTRVPQPQIPPPPPTRVSQPPIPPPPPSGVPPPPIPPSFWNGQINSLKVPPPPPSLTQQMPLGKDGSPLPKLKPLHWDKVRAAPNRSTVWDKLHSSSFE